MRRWGMVLALSVCPVLLVAQVAVTPSGWATTAGPAVPSAQPGAPLVVTPEVQLGTYSPSAVGATNATGNNAAGATNATINNVTPVAGSTQMSVQYSVPYPTEVGVGGEYATVPAGVVLNTPSGVSTRLPYFDRGAAQFASAYDIGIPQPTTSLGELARTWRQKKESLNARTFTNEDINRIDQQYGPPTGGVSAAAVNAGSAATGVTATQTPSNVGTTTAPPRPRSPFTPPPQVTAPSQPSAPPPQEQAMAQYQPPMQASGQVPAGASQQQPPSQAGQQQRSEQALPGTASQMPTFLIIGGVAVLAGMLLRRRNQRRSGVGF